MLGTLKEAVRRRLPRQQRVLNSVLVETYRRGPDDPDFEGHQADWLRENISAGDRVIVVGAGHGVCSTVAAGLGAEVTAYEASPLWAEVARRTFELNGVGDRAEVVEGVVGEALDPWGEPAGRTVAAPDLPACDALVLDCEGAESVILDTLGQRPRLLSVEVHEPHATTRRVAEWMGREGYEYEVHRGTGANVVQGERR